MDWLIHIIYLFVGFTFGMLIGCFYYKFKRTKNNLDFVTGLYEQLCDKYENLSKKVYVINPKLEDNPKDSE